MFHARMPHIHTSTYCIYVHMYVDNSHKIFVCKVAFNILPPGVWTKKDIYREQIKHQEIHIESRQSFNDAPLGDE